MIVAPGSVKHATLAVRANPGPRFAPAGIKTKLQHRTVLVVVHVMNVGLVPAFEAAETLHDRMIRLSDLGAEDAGAVSFELSAQERHHFRRVAEAITGAVQRHESTTAGDKLE